MGIKIVPHPPYSPDHSPRDFWLFPKLRGCRYEEMKEAVTRVIGTLTQENFHGSFQKLLERHSKCIAVGGDYFEGDKSFMCALSIKVPTRKMSGNLFNDPRMLREISTFEKKLTTCRMFESISWNWQQSYIRFVLSYLPTPPLGQDMTNQTEW